LGVLDDVDIVMGTFSKSLASVGGFIAAERAVVDYLKHTARPFVFSASLPAASVAAVGAALQIMRKEPERRLHLLRIANLLREELRARGFSVMPGETAIVPVDVYKRQAHNRFHQEKAGFFGFYESADDVEVAQALLAQARSWVKAKGAEFLRGPVNPSTNYECGTLVEGFDSDPMIMMTYNPPYYPALMDKIGLRKCKDLYAYLSNANTIEMKKIDRVADRVLATTGVRVRPIDMKNFQRDVEKVWDVYNAAWAKNWGFIPMSREEFMLMGKEMKQILKPELVLIGELGDRVVGFALALPDVNQALKPAKGSLFLSLIHI